VTGFASDIAVNAPPAGFVGEFDPVLLAEALKSISAVAQQIISAKAADGLLEIDLKDEAAEGGRYGVIEWKILDSSEHDPFRSFAGSNEIRLALAAKVIEAHGGSAKREQDALCVRLPLDSE
jgi:hypothetical protein